MSLYTVEATLILDNEGRRLLAEYYAPRESEGGDSGSHPLARGGLAEQRAFEKKLSNQTVGENGDILLLDGHVVVYKQCADVLIYLVGDAEQNEELLYDTLLTLRDCISSLLGHQVDKTNVVERYDRVALAVDELIDNGVVLGPDAFHVLDKVSTSATEEPTLQNIDLSEGGLKNMFNLAKGRLTQAVRKQLG